MSNSLQLHGLHSPWNSPGQNTVVGSHSCLQEIWEYKIMFPFVLNNVLQLAIIFGNSKPHLMKIYLGLFHLSCCQISPCICAIVFFLTYLQYFEFLIIVIITFLFTQRNKKQNIDHYPIPNQRHYQYISTCPFIL